MLKVYRKCTNGKQEVNVMKHLKDSLKKLDEKYVTVEALSQEDKESTYGGAVSAKKAKEEDLICYGAPPRPVDPNEPVLA